MKILYFIPRYDSTAMGNRIHAEVIDAWRSHGVEAEVITLSAGLRRFASTLEEGILVHRLPVSAGLPFKAANRALGPLFHYPYLAGALGSYRRFVQRNRYDLVHIETAFPLGLVAALAPGAQAPLAVTLPGADIMAEPEFDYGYGRFRAVRAVLPLVFRRAAVLRADSPQIRDLALRLGANPAKVTAIPYNITDSSYPPPTTNLAQFRAISRAMLLERHHLDPQRPIVLSLSRLHPFKGVAYLVEALPQLRQGGLHPQVLIVGPSRSTPRFGDYGAYIQQRARELGVASDVCMVGGIAQTETRAYLAAADAVVVPSVAESFNRVTVEAAAMGTPAVVTRTTGVSAYVAEQRCGLVVEPRSASAIAEALSLLLSDPALWHNLSERAVTMASGFSSAAIATELLRLYRPHVPSYVA